MKSKELLLSAAILGTLAIGGCSSSSKKAETATSLGECHGVNSCKGQGECGGKGHGCAGKNACKGKGWISMSKAECQKNDGKFKR